MSLETRITKLELGGRDDPRFFSLGFAERLRKLLERDEPGPPDAEQLRELEALPPPHELDWQTRDLREHLRKIFRRNADKEASHES